MQALVRGRGIRRSGRQRPIAVPWGAVRTRRVAAQMLILGAALSGPLGAEPVRSMSASVDGGVADGDSALPSGPRFDDAGRYAVFLSQATDLVPGQAGPSANNVFSFDRFTGRVRLVSHQPGAPTTGGDGGASEAKISADGQFVVFESRAPDLVAGQVDAASTPDLFLWSRATDEIVLVSHHHASTTTVANGGSGFPVISADGRFVAYQSLATDLVAGASDGNGGTDVFLFDRQGSTRLVSARNQIGSPVAGNGASGFPSLSADGRFVAFQTEATDLRPVTDANGSLDVYLWSRLQTPLAASRLLSRTAAASVTAGNGPSGIPILSADGGFVVFTSSASDLANTDLDTNADNDVFVHDRLAGTLKLLSHSSADPGTTANDSSFGAGIDAAGSVVVVQSRATDLVDGQIDESASFDLFLWRRDADSHVLVTHEPGAPRAAAQAPVGGVRVTADGGTVVFSSGHEALVEGQVDSNELDDVFAWRAATDSIELLSHLPGNPLATGFAASFPGTPDGSGRVVPFASDSADLLGLVDPDGHSLALFHGPDDVLFVDDFESGDLSAWDAPAP